MVLEDTVTSSIEVEAMATDFDVIQSIDVEAMMTKVFFTSGKFMSAFFSEQKCPP